MGRENPRVTVSDSEIVVPIPDETVLRARLKTRILGRATIEIHRRIDSTIRRARDLARRGVDEGTLILAETQSGGRGRHGRIWHSPPGKNIYLSMVLRPDIDRNRTPILTLAAALGAADAVSRLTEMSPVIKWPNDILLGHGKIAGILTEAEIRAANLHFLILSIGMNVNMSLDDVPPDLVARAGSLSMATGRSWNRIEVLAVLLEAVDRRYLDLLDGGADRMIDLYRLRCGTIGSMVRVGHGPHGLQGLAEDVSSRGELLVRRLSDGRLVRVAAGEIQTPLGVSEPSY